MVDADPVQDLAVKMKDSTLNEYGTIKDINYNKRKNQLSFRLTYEKPSFVDRCYATGHDLRAALSVSDIKNVSFNRAENTIELEGRTIFKITGYEDFVFINNLGGPEEDIFLQAYKITLKWASENTEDPKDDEEEEK